MKRTFTYINLATKEPVIQHNITELESIKIEGAHVSAKFTDDKGRKLHIVTNQPFHFRAEELLPVEEPAPEPVAARPTLAVED